MFRRFASLFLFALTQIGAVERADVVKALMNAGRVEDLRKALAEAEGLGMGSQPLAEAKLMYGIRTADAKFLAGVMKDVERGLIGFDARDSIGGLQTVEQYRGLMCLARAMIARDDGDEETFREEVNKGLWLFPEQANIFGRLVALHQMQTRMAHLRMDFTSPLIDSNGRPDSLGGLIGTEKAILLFFWSSTAQNGSAGLPELLSQTPRLKHAGIAIAGVNVEAKNPDIVAREYQEANGVAIPWVAESGPRSLARMLEIGSVPRAVLVSREGRVLFNGHPKDPVLWRTISVIAPGFVPPVFR